MKPAPPVIKMCPAGKWLLRSVDETTAKVIPPVETMARMPKQ
jgi:hypothetical protein